MFDNIAEFNIAIREILNGALFSLSMFLSALVLIFMFSGWERSNHDIAQWRATPGISTACTLFLIFMAEGMRSGTVWLVYRTSDRYAGLVASNTPLWTTIMFIATACLLFAGLSKGIYLFTPPAWANKTILTAAITTIVFLTISHLLP